MIKRLVSTADAARAVPVVWRIMSKEDDFAVFK